MVQSVKVKSRLFVHPDILGTLALALAVGLPAVAAAGEYQIIDPIALELRKSQEPDEIDWNALNWDPWSLTSPAKPRGLDAPHNPVETPASWDQKLNADGTASVTVKKQLPTTLDAKVGVDLGLAPADSNQLQLERMVTGSNPTSSGAAWANMSISGASFEARLDPRQEQAKLGTTLKKSVPIGSAMSVSLENGYSVTDTLATSNTVTPLPGMMAMPQPTTPAALAPARIYSTDGIARLTYAPSGTTLSTGTRLSSTDEKWRRSVGAEQKLFGGLNISGSVNENDTGTLDKSISAGFKQTW